MWPEANRELPGMENAFTRELICEAHSQYEYEAPVLYIHTQSSQFVPCLLPFIDMHPHWSAITWK